MLTCNYAKPVTLLPSEPIIHSTNKNCCGFNFNYSEKKKPNICVGATANGNCNPMTSVLPKSSAPVVKVGAPADSFAVKVKVRGLFPGLDFAHPWDTFVPTLNLELISTELDTLTGKEKDRVKASVRGSIIGNEICERTFEAYLEVPAGFGGVGALTVENDHHKDVFLHDIILEGFSHGPVTFSCKSWVHSKYLNPTKRIFFTTKCYLPSATPDGLKKVRNEELENLGGRGDEDERKSFDRIYDYDKYNDPGDPDKDPDLKRPTLGGHKHPYPRRCRTGRPPAKTDRASESKSSGAIYVPSDETFSRLKNMTFRINLLKAVIHGLVPRIKSRIGDSNFPTFTAIDALFNEGIELSHGDVSLAEFLPRIVKGIKDTGREILRYDLPQMLDKDKFSWLSDEEFGRQTLSGLNPLGIQLVTEWPLKSELDHQRYGPAESKITKEIVQKQIGGSMTVEEAIKQKKLFILDYHDILLPYVAKVRELQGFTLYGSRTLFFLADDGTLSPVAIELTRPPIDNKPEWKQVFVPNQQSFH